MNIEVSQLEKVNWQTPRNLPANWRIVNIKEHGGTYESCSGMVVVASCVKKPGRQKHIVVSAFKQDTYPLDGEISQITSLFFSAGDVEVFKIPVRPEWGNHFPYCITFCQPLQED